MRNPISIHDLPTPFPRERRPQTVGEIKAHTERLHVFPDLESVELTLRDLHGAEYAAKMKRQPGRKKSRYAHLLSGTPEDVQEEETVPLTENQSKSEQRSIYPPARP